MGNTNDQLIFENINPITLGIQKPKKKKKKFWRGQDYFLYSPASNRTKLEIYINSDTAKEIIDFYGTDIFNIAISKKCGVVYMFPTIEETQSSRKIYKGGNDSHYSISISEKEKKENLFNAIGAFRRMHVVVAIDEKHLLIVPDKKNKNNEYAD